MCLSGRLLQFATSQRDGLPLMTERVRTHRSVVRTLVRLLTVAAIKQTVCRCIWSSVRSCFLQARRLESSPACFALSSRCFLAQRFPPSREEVEAIRGVSEVKLSGNVAAVFRSNQTAVVCGYWRILSLSGGLLWSLQIRSKRWVHKIVCRFSLYNFDQANFRKLFVKSSLTFFFQIPTYISKCFFQLLQINM